MKRFVVFFLVFLTFFSISCNKGRGKIKEVSKKSEKIGVEYKKIGDLQWVTEAGFEKVKEIAKRDNKKVFMVFSAYWCVPCQMLKHKVLSNKEIEGILSNFIPVYIEGTTKEGAELCKRFNIRAFPTIIITNPEGVEVVRSQGARDDVSFYKNWLSLIEKGITVNNIVDLIKNNRIDCDEVSGFIKSMSFDDYDKKIEILENALEHLDCARHNEKIFFLFLHTLSEKVQNDRGSNTIVKRYEGLINGAIKNLPLKYQKLAQLEFNCLIGECKSQLANANAVLNNFELKDLLLSHSKELADTLIVLAENGRNNKVFSIFEKAISIIKGEKNDLKAMINQFSLVVLKLCDYFKTKGMKESAERVGGYLFQLVHYFKSPSLINETYLSQAIGYLAYFNGIEVDEYQSLLKKDLLKLIKSKTLSKRQVQNAMMMFRSLLNVNFKWKSINQAETDVKALIGNGEGLMISDKYSRALILNDICWSFVEKKYSDNYLISLSEQSVKLSKTPEFLDTLAHLYVIKGEYNKAIDTEKEAVEILKSKNPSEKELKPYLEALSKWEKKVKNR